MRKLLFIPLLLLASCSSTEEKKDYTLKSIGDYVGTWSFIGDGPKHSLVVEADGTCVFYDNKNEFVLPGKYEFSVNHLTANVGKMFQKHKVDITFDSANATEGLYPADVTHTIIYTMVENDTTVYRYHYNLWKKY